jgi:hypothetical protein
LPANKRQSHPAARGYRITLSSTILRHLTCTDMITMSGTAVVGHQPSQHHIQISETPHPVRIYPCPSKIRDTSVRLVSLSQNWSLVCLVPGNDDGPRTWRRCVARLVLALIRERIHATRSTRVSLSHHLAGRTCCPSCEAADLAGCTPRSLSFQSAYNQLDRRVSLTVTDALTGTIL